MRPHVWGLGHVGKIWDLFERITGQFEGVWDVLGDLELLEGVWACLGRSVWWGVGCV